MKKSFFIAIALMLSQFAMAQTVDSKVNAIREQYGKAQETAKWKTTDEWMEHGCYTIDLKSRVNYAGGGVVNTNTEVLLTVNNEYEEPDFNTVKPVLTRETSERSGKIYREMLFDEQNGDLIFCYQRGETNTGGTAEQRFYFENGKLLKAVPSKMEDSPYMLSAEDVKKAAAAMKAIVKNFNNLGY